MSLRRTAARSVLWSALENGSTTLIAFLSLIIFAKLLSPSDFGVFSVSLAIMEVAAVFTNMIFHDALIQRHDVTDDHFHGALTVSLVLSVVVYAGLWLAFPGLASLVGDDRIGAVGRVLGLGLLVTGPTGILAARQSREFAFRILAVRTLAGRLCGASLGIIAAFLGFGLWSLVIQQLAVMLLSSATLLFYSSAHVRLGSDLRPVRDLLGYSVASVGSLSAVFIGKRVFVFGVGLFLGTQTAGFLNLAFRLVDTVWAISATAVSQVLLPTLSRLQDDPSRLVNAYRVSLKIAAAILYPGFAGLGLLAPELIQLLFGDKWSPSSGYVLILSLLTSVQVPRLAMSPLLSTTGHIADVCFINLAVLAYMGVAIAVTRLPSDYGALAVWCGGEALTFGCMTAVLHRRLGIPALQQLSDIIAPLLAATAMIGTVRAVRAVLPPDLALPLQIMELALVGALTYLGLMLLFGRQYVQPVVGMARVLWARD